MGEYFVFPNPTGPTSAVSIDAELCVGCNSCANICRIQTILPNAEKGKPPIVAYPDECWYCGCCVEACPTGALEMRLPINQRIMFKDRESGEVFRLGTKDAPQKTFFKAPYGWLERPELDSVMKMLEDPGVSVTAVISSETGLKIGRYFGEKETADDTDRLIRFLMMTGFSKVIMEKEYLHDKTEKEYIIGIDTAPEGADTYLDTKGLSVLLHRMCVSNHTAVRVWRSLSDQ
ncbi:MAG: 4Fe-4S dicluster domain-containing protein [Lachnospiraceae bacterium]|nr:4Fe-4S dicluster domain-containing protein [Lachnospiraceae bacterium]